MAFLESGSGCNFSTAQAVTATAASTNIYDVTGAGSGNAPAMIGAGGVNTAIGIDIGAGAGLERPEVLITIGTCTTVTGTLTIALQAAPDNGSYSPGTYYTLSSTAALTGATELFAGAQIVLPVPPVPPGFAFPRFYKLEYTVGSSISVLVSANLSVNVPTQRTVTQYGNNFPAGL
ncbi:MAG: Bbp16 family capsid cement protein [Alphaproteobacteria bacterium]